MLQCAPNLSMMSPITWVLKVGQKLLPSEIIETKRNFHLLQARTHSASLQKTPEALHLASIQCNPSNQQQVELCATQLWSNKKNASCRKSKSDKSGSWQWSLIKKSRCKRSTKRTKGNKNYKQRRKNAAELSSRLNRSSRLNNLPRNSRSWKRKLKPRLGSKKREMNSSRNVHRIKP